MTEASKLLDVLGFELNENYALKIVDWLNGKSLPSWSDLKQTLELLFTTRTNSLIIEVVDCTDSNMEMWAEEGKRIYICTHILKLLSDEEVKAKLLHELSHILRHRQGRQLGAPKPNVFLSGREYPARAFEIAWIVSSHYSSLDKYLKDIENRVLKAVRLLQDDDILRAFDTLMTMKPNDKFMKLADKYIKVLSYYRRRHGLV